MSAAKNAARVQESPEAVIREALKHAKRNASMPHVVAKFDAGLAALDTLVC